MTQTTSTSLDLLRDEDDEATRHYEGPFRPVARNNSATTTTTTISPNNTNNLLRSMIMTTNSSSSSSPKTTNLNQNGFVVVDDSNCTGGGVNVGCSDNSMSASSVSSSDTTMSGMDSCDEEMSRIYCCVKFRPNSGSVKDENRAQQLSMSSLSSGGQAKLTLACSTNRPCLDLDKMRKV